MTSVRINNSIVTGIRRPKLLRMSSLVSHDVPKSPLNTWPIQLTYWMCTGWSRPKCASSLARSSALAVPGNPADSRASITEPGTSRIRPNTKIDSKITVIGKSIKRRKM